MKKDFKFIVDLIDDFTSQDNIIERLNIIENKNITGWEIWFQVEFASFLSNHSDIGNWFRECSFAIDGRKDKNKNKMLVDFLIRKKNHKRESYIALEIKQNKSIDSCISKMIEDIIKVKKRVPSSTELRSFWSIGIHPYKNIDEIRYKIEKKQEEKQFTLDKFIEIQQIRNTNFAFTIF